MNMLKNLLKRTKQSHQTLFYCKYSDTVRQAPENFLIAARKDGRWICEPDMASNKKMASDVFSALFVWDNKYGTGENLIAATGRQNDPQLMGLHNIQKWEKLNGRKYSLR